MTRLQIICPSRGRPERLKTMLDSFDATKSEGTDMIIYVADDDPKIKEYKYYFPDRNIQFGDRLFISEVFNKFSADGHKYYGEVNDDHIYQTPGWDNILIDHIEKQGKGWGIACGWDMMQPTPAGWLEQKKPSACIISGNIISTLGYMIHPCFQHLFIDDYFRELAIGIESLHFDPNVIIEHQHIFNKRVAPDAVYQWAYSPVSWDYGWNAYHYYMMNKLAGDIKKIKEARCA